jgi:hypothetical protein
MTSWWSLTGHGIRTLYRACGYSTNALCEGHRFDSEAIYARVKGVRAENTFRVDDQGELHGAGRWTRWKRNEKRIRDISDLVRKL